MTIEHPATVLALLAEDPSVRIYSYIHRRTGRVLYAVFPQGQYDDMTESPEVLVACLLFEAGHPTPDGQVWLDAVKKGEP
jgi:hypothetical protein